MVRWIPSLALVACASTSSGGSADFEFNVQSSATFAFESITAVQENVNQASNATLQAVTCDVASPAGTTFAFLEDFEGSAVLGTQQTQIVSFEPADSPGTSAALKVVYHGDVRPFFPDGHTLVVQWSGHMDPSLVPASGIDIKCHVVFGT